MGGFSGGAGGGGVGGVQVGMWCSGGGFVQVGVFRWGCSGGGVGYSGGGGVFIFCSSSKVTVEKVIEECCKL